MSIAERCLEEGLSALTALQKLVLRGCEGLTGCPALTELQTLDLTLCGGLRGLPEGLTALRRSG